MSLNIENAQITMSLMGWEDAKRQLAEKQTRIDELEAELRETRYRTPASVKQLVKAVLGARIVIGYAMSQLSPAESKGWPSNELRQFVAGLAIIDDLDLSVKESVRDFASFADEIDEAEAIRRARTSGDTGLPHVPDAEDAIVDRLLREAEESAAAAMSVGHDRHE